MFSKTAAWYDAIYGNKDYAREARQVDELIRLHRKSDGNALLDVACGTGAHLAHLSKTYNAEGLDADAQLLAIARERLPQVRFHLGDMCAFDLHRTFDVVTCLFSSIGYAKAHERLLAAISCFARHLRPGGALVLEPWLVPGQFTAGYLSVEVVDRPDLKIARMQRSTIEGDVSILNFGYLVGTPGSIEHFTERHELGLFTREQMDYALRACQLDLHYDPKGLIGRGLYVATKSAVT